MRDYKAELEKRVEYIQNLLRDSHTSGIVFGNSGGKDSALVGILCKKACENTVGIIMPCHSKRNFGMDKDDGEALANKFGIESRMIDLTEVRAKEIEVLEGITTLNEIALTNLAPRLRMISLYAVAAAENRLVAGTGNRSERYMGYFTKWGDGACDFNPIADLTVGEIYEFLRFLDAPEEIITKAPSAGLFEGQTDEAEMGVTYKAIDEYLLTGKATEADLAIMKRYHGRSEHKRKPVSMYEVCND